MGDVTSLGPMLEAGPVPAALLACLALWPLAACAARAPEPAEADDRSDARERMVQEALVAAGIRDERVLAAMRAVPRHRYVPELQRGVAYEDVALAIGHGQTISQPYVVAFMSEALELDGTERVLEIGTSPGYQAAVLSELAAEVFTIEIVEELGRAAIERLAHRPNVHVRIGDGYRGLPAEAPFDAIMLTAAPDHVPEPLVDQLAPGGRMILPVGERTQELVLLERTESGIERRAVLPVRFVPMTGEARETR